MKITLKAPVGISNRHVHLTEQDYIILFGNKDITVRNYLTQPGEFASNSTVSLKNKDGKLLENVRIIGPFRKYSQVEISKTDSYFLKVNPPVRKSGDIKDSEALTIVGPAGELNLKEGVIIANRHLHLDKKTAEEMGVRDDFPFIVNIDTEKKGRMIAYVKVLDEAVTELHFDTDDANAFLLNNGDILESFYED